MNTRGEVKEKLEGKKGTVTMYLKGIPVRAHKKIIDYQRKINYERTKHYNLQDAYVEWLKETTKPKSL